MKTLGLILVAALLIPAASAKVNVTTIAAASTIAVNVITIDQTAKRVWKGLKFSKRAVVKAAKKVAGK